jgi:rubrerythrin
MDIYEFAKKMEKDGEALYRELAEKNAGNPGVRTIMTMLADEEVKHYRILNEMESEAPGPIEDGILTKARNVFEQMKQRNETFDPNSPHADLYLKAQEIEKRSIEFYEKLGQDSKIDWHKDLFKRLGEEERKHYFLLDNIVEFVGRPRTWLENAEWHHLDEY